MKAASRSGVNPRFSGRTKPPPRRSLRVGAHTIGEAAPVFVIAEIGVNHDGCVARAKALVDAAVAAGADCVKFQMRSPHALFANGGNPADPAEDLGSQYVLDILRQAQLDPEEMFEAFDYARARGVECLCTPWDPVSLAAVVDYGLPAIKIASADLTNHGLLEAVARAQKPVLLSTGMSTEQEIREAVTLLERLGAQFALLHCVSVYPPHTRDIDLRYLARLERIGGGRPVGYSGHERGWAVTLAAVALGAAIIEKHFTLDRDRPGVDHKVSLLPQEFAAMVRGIREVEEALGTSEERRLRHGERINRSVLAKSLIARRPIRAGEPIEEDMVDVRSPGVGLQPNRLPELLGRVAVRCIPQGQPFFASDLRDHAPRPRAYRFRRPWGVPVRFHDFARLTRVARPDFVEFHLSYRDLELDPATFLEGPYPFGFTVHSPDQFGDDLVLDLAAEREAERRASIHELQRVINLARRLAPYFPSAARPLVIANLGGFSFTEREVSAPAEELYERVAAGLADLDTTGVDLVPQTLPRFPWLFGGQRVAHLFTRADDTAAFCERHGLGLCLDTSHTYMAAAYYAESFESYCERLAPFTVHLHLSDAAGVDGEGLQIGEGELDFGRLATQLDRLAPGCGFVPEVWQGHWNGGEGFWCALERLERWFGKPLEAADTGNGESAGEGNEYRQDVAARS